MSKTNQRGYEISYHLKGVGVANMTEMVYAESSHQAIELIKARYKGSEFLSGPFYTLKTTHDEKDGNAITFVFFGIASIAALYFLFILVINLFNFNKISNYDIGLYFNNIKNFHTDGGYRTTNQKINMNIISPDSLMGEVSISKNKIFIYEGEKGSDNNTTLIALSYYDKDTHVYGYYTQNAKNTSLQVIDEKIQDIIRKKIKNMFKDELSIKVDLLHVQDKEVEKLESEGYNIVDRLTGEKMSFLYKNESENEVELIENKYYSEENFQKLYIQIGESYLINK